MFDETTEPEKLPAPACDGIRIAPRYWPILTDDRPLETVAALIPACICDQIIEELSASLEPLPSRERALYLAKLLVDSYPARELNNPAVFFRHLEALFLEFPADIGLQSIGVLARRYSNLPSIALVSRALGDLKGVRRSAIRRAQAHKAEAARREEEQRRRAATVRREDLPEELRKTFDSLVALANRTAERRAPDRDRDGGTSPAASEITTAME